MSKVAVNIVTWNSSEYIPTCLDAVRRQTYRDIEITVLDNGSSDGIGSTLAPYLEHGIKLIQNPCNIGYAAAHNQLIRATDSDFVLTLNPDVRLMPDFVEQLVEAMHGSSKYGAASGQLRSVTREQLLTGAPGANDPLVIDEAGLGILHSRRQYARGYGKPAHTHCTRPALIFGPCGAAAFYRRAMLEDVSVNGEYFDEAFFVHKEDVDLAWRAQLLGWQSYYTPRALGFHVRAFHPGQRRGMSVTIRRHALKNRWLMAVKNEVAGTFLPDLPRILLYELQIFGYLLLKEQDALSAYIDFLRLLPQAIQWRRVIQQRVQTKKSDIYRWFDEGAE